MQTWQSEPGTDEICSECGSVYAVVVSRFPARDKDKFDCVVCGHTIRSWNDTYSWSYTLKERAAWPRDEKTAGS